MGGKGTLSDWVSRTLTRRHMLAGIVGGVGLLVASSALPLWQGLGGKVAAGVELTQGAFARVVGTAFRVDVANGQAATIQLLAVHPLPVPLGRAPTGEGFGLIFTGRLSERFGQGTYTVDHPTLGRFAMFLVPIGPAGPDQRYEAVFNRLWK